jgi:hypothetical protein
MPFIRVKSNSIICKIVINDIFKKKKNECTKY